MAQLHGARPQPGRCERRYALARLSPAGELRLDETMDKAKRDTKGRSASAQRGAPKAGGSAGRSAAQSRGRAAKRSVDARDGDQPLWLYGRHAVAAALDNPERQCLRALATKNARDWLGAERLARLSLDLEDAKPDAIDRLLPAGAVHQGLAASVSDLPRARLKEACADPRPSAPVVVLDQVTDPQNIGAIFRAAAAFGARAIIVQDRRTPPLAGALAKAAVGAVERLPCVRVVNIARALEALGDMGYYRAGLAGEADASIEDSPARPLALVVGAEGTGLRQLVAQTCDALFRIEITDAVESLNVATATAIALHATRSRL